MLSSCSGIAVTLRKENRILRRIFKSKWDENREFGRRRSDELQGLYLSLSLAI